MLHYYNVIIEDEKWVKSGTIQKASETEREAVRNVKERPEKVNATVQPSLSQQRFSGHPFLEMDVCNQFSASLFVSLFI